MEVIYYVLSIPLQLSGALLLIFFYFSDELGKIKQKYFPGSNFAEPNNENKVCLKKDRVQELAREIYLNRVAFIYIAAGYFLGIFANLGEFNKELAFVMIFGLTVILLIGAWNWCIRRAKKKYPNDLWIDWNEVADTVDGVATADDISKMFENISVKEKDEYSE